MKINIKLALFLVFLMLSLSACKGIDIRNGGSDDDNDAIERLDDAVQLDIDLSGSLQNPAFINGGESIVFTRFRDGYNEGASDLFIYNLDTKTLQPLIFDGKNNVNIPGSVWDDTSNTIVFSSDKDAHDEIFIISDTGSTGDETQLTNRDDKQSFEPTFSPDGNWVVFESHNINTTINGVITKFKVDGSSEYIDLTSSAGDSRQPNWSPHGNKILYQKIESGNWVIWVMDDDGTNHQRITNINEDNTDASFSFDGQWIYYSSENNNVELANIYRIFATGGEPRRITNYSGYDGAPSISPDDTTVVFESADEEPEDSEGTTLWMIDL